MRPDRSANPAQEASRRPVVRRGRPALAMALAAFLLAVPAIAAPPERDADRTACLAADELGEPEAVITACTGLLDSGAVTGADAVTALLNRADALATLEEYERAIRDGDEALRRSPGNAAAHHRRANILWMSGDEARALADFDAVVRLNPSDSEGFATRGGFLAATGDLARALADHDRWVALRPDDTNALLARADILRRQGQVDRAVVDLEEVTRLDPRSWTAYSRRGVVFLQAGRLDRAQEDLDRSLRIWTGNPVALSDRCVVRWRRGQREAAFADCAEAQRVLRSLASVPNVWPWAAEAGVRLLAGDLPGAQAATTEALRRNPHDARALALRSLLHQRRGDPASARADMEAAREGMASVRDDLRLTFGPGLFPPEGR